MQLQPGAVFTDFGPIPELLRATPGVELLGARLSENPKLSGSGQIACASRHNGERPFADGVSCSFCHDTTTLNSHDGGDVDPVLGRSG